ncbi:MAG: penicillin-binding protein 2 [Pseudomonadota bacterium]|nr:penicillin-binding protein 2 [Pseudomonadota bacterium]
MSLPRNTLCINPYMLHKLSKKEINRYKPFLELIKTDNNKFIKLINKYKQRKEFYLKRKINDELASKISKLDLPFVYFIKEYHRVYLGGEAFSNIIGFTNIDDIGQEGIELSKNELLISKKGLKKIKKDNLGRSIQTLEIVKQPISGKDIFLSLDKNIQIIGYNILKKYVERFSADSASLILVKNQTGEIISMVNYPSFNPESRNQMKGINIKNRVATEVFEPGSTIKPFIILSALNTNTIGLDDFVDTTPGIIKIGDKKIKDPRNYGRLTLSQIIEKSSNVGAVLVSRSLNKKDLWNTLTSLQFGQNLYTGFSGEQFGELNHHSQWKSVNQETMAYGYGISTTLLHLSSAYSILANHGKSIQLTYQKVENDDEIYQEDVIDPILSKEILKMMMQVVKKGTGTKASLDKYTVAGKTGTVQILKEQGYTSEEHNTLFIGVVPATNPQYVAAIIVRKPDPGKGKASGGKNAAPIFKEFMSQSLNLLKVYPDKKIVKNERK